MKDTFTNKIADNPTTAKMKNDLQGLESLLALCKITGLGRIMGINAKEHEEKLREMKSDIDKIINAPDRFNELMGERGWIAYESLNATLMHSCIGLAQDGKFDEAEELLISHYSKKENTDWQMRRLRSIGVFSKRYDILKVAYEDYNTGRYYTCVPLFITMIDGAVDELRKTNKGFFAEGVDLTAWDSTAGHPTGLEYLAKIFSIPQKKVTTDEIRLPYRNGILHGKDLGYGNIYVASKLLAALFSVADFARAVLSEKARQDEAASKNKGWKEIRDTQKQTQRTYKAIDQWKPRVLDSTSIILEDGTPEQAVDMFFKNHIAKRHALTIARLYQPSGSKKPIGALIDRYKTALEENTILRYSIISIEDEAPAISNVIVEVEAQTSNKSIITKNVKCRAIYETEKGKPLVRGQKGGCWYLIDNVVWDLYNLTFF